MGPSERPGVDEHEIELVYRRRAPGFVRAMVAITGSQDDARDVVQEAFARGLAARADFRFDGSLAAWIWRIALNVALTRRGKPVESPLEEAFAVELPPSIADPALTDALRRLPTRQRLMVFLYYLADLSYEDVAATCGISAGTVGATLSHARSTLAALLEEPYTATKEGRPR
jgi:RNA polymerase sigma-70 factor (ECF subfamily)